MNRGSRAEALRYVSRENKAARHDGQAEALRDVNRENRVARHDSRTEALRSGVGHADRQIPIGRSAAL
jgi:hypothetical protein